MVGPLAFTALTGDVKDVGQASAGVFVMGSALGAYTAPARSRGVGDGAGRAASRIAREGATMAKKRFVRIYYAGVFEQQRVYVDTLTGVNYLLLICNTNNMGSGLTVLLDADGKPVVTPLDEIDRLAIEDDD